MSRTSDGQADPRDPQSERSAVPRLTLRVSEVAASCGVSTKTVQRWIESEGLPVVRRRAAGAREITLVLVEDLEDWLRDGRVDPAATPPEPPTVRLHSRRFLREDSSLDNHDAPRSRDHRSQGGAA